MGAHSFAAANWSGVDMLSESDQDTGCLLLALEPLSLLFSFPDSDEPNGHTIVLLTRRSSCCAVRRILRPFVVSEIKAPLLSEMVGLKLLHWWWGAAWYYWCIPNPPIPQIANSLLRFIDHHAYRIGFICIQPCMNIAIH
jgi:hypothetical protein